MQGKVQGKGGARARTVDLQPSFGEGNWTFACSLSFQRRPRIFPKIMHFLCFLGTFLVLFGHFWGAFGAPSGPLLGRINSVCPCSAKRSLTCVPKRHLSQRHPEPCTPHPQDFSLDVRKNRLRYQVCPALGHRTSRPTSAKKPRSPLEPPRGPQKGQKGHQKCTISLKKARASLER